MSLYLEMLKKPVFSSEDAVQLCKNSGTAKNHLSRLAAEGRIERIRRDLYTCISPETGLPVANKYQIASAITPTSCVSHHTALEYYGAADQVYYDVYVSSATKFKEFEYDGYTYRCIVSANNCDITQPDFTNGIKITGMERTVIDSIKDMDKVAGLEEVIAAIELLPMIDEQKLIENLSFYGNQFTYQKTGFILERYKEQFALSDYFFEYCREKAGKSKRYLTNDVKCTIWNREWNLMVPENVFGLKNGGLNEF